MYMAFTFLKYFINFEETEGTCISKKIGYYIFWDGLNVILLPFPIYYTACGILHLKG